MSALCYWCQNPNWLTRASQKLGTEDPVGECDSCSVHTCNGHGVRGTRALFVCLVCVPSQVSQHGLTAVLQTFPDLEERLRRVEADINSTLTR
jgi:hypothetical protein